MLQGPSLKLRDAISLLNRPAEGEPLFELELVTGFTPEPLSTFICAYLQQSLAGRRVVAHTGLFGDLIGNLTRALDRDQAPVVMAIEWAEIDPRLGLRNPGSWGRGTIADIVQNATQRLEWIASQLEHDAGRQPVYILGPVLPLPPVLPVALWQPNALEIELASIWQSFVARVSHLKRIRPISARFWGHIPPRDRLDVKSWLQAGSPYRLAFASELAKAIALCILPPAPLKGIITDLDNTLWSGILGEVGVDNVAWTLDHHASTHGVYQLALQALAEDGVLVAVASKNDQQLVGEALRRTDLLIRPDSIFPVEAHWQPKAESAARILEAWNIGPESVMFIDDSPLEVEAMGLAFPSMRGRVFPARDPDAVFDLISELADSFGKATRREEDVIRLQSLRQSARREAVQKQGYSQDQVLRESEGRLTITALTSLPDPRALELVNKTNQFNLNGRRYTEADWVSLISRGRAWIAAYQDKFGPLGKIAVLAGQPEGANEFRVECWVMSCRAFSRRIEYAMLDFLFRQEIEVLHLNFEPTDRNGPLREFIEAVTGKPAVAPVCIPRAIMESARPSLFLAVTAL